MASSVSSTIGTSIFLALASPQCRGASTPIQLTLQPTPMSHIDSPAIPSAADPTMLPIPTGRNIRLRLRGLGAHDPGNLYFGNDAARTGLIADLRVRYEAAAEDSLLVDSLLTFNCRPSTCAISINPQPQDIVTSSVVQVITQNAGRHIQSAGLVNLVNTLTPPATTPIQLLASALHLPLTGQTDRRPSRPAHSLRRGKHAAAHASAGPLQHHLFQPQRPHQPLDRRPASDPRPRLDLVRPRPERRRSARVQLHWNHVRRRHQPRPAGSPRSNRHVRRRLLACDTGRHRTREPRQYGTHLLLHDRLHHRRRFVPAPTRQLRISCSPPSPARRRRPSTLWNGRSRCPSPRLHARFRGSSRRASRRALTRQHRTTRPPRNETARCGSNSTVLPTMVTTPTSSESSTTARIPC